ncbi:MAG: acyltransferase [Candidatus Caldarchaeum sp.]
MSGYLSPRAKISGTVSKNCHVYGSTEVGVGTFIDELVTLGYPTRERLLKAMHNKHAEPLEILDSASLGSFVGPASVIRRWTIVYDEVIIEGCVEIGHNVLIRSGSIIRTGSRIGSGTMLDGSVLIGKEVNIQSNVYIPHLTKVMDRAFVGPNVVMTNDSYPVGSPLKGPTIGVGAIIGAGAVILPGVEVGDGAVVGAGSVVTRNVRPNEVVYGVPARFAYKVDEYLKKKQALYEKR